MVEPIKQPKRWTWNFLATGEISLEQSIRSAADEGNPIVISSPESVAAKPYPDIAFKVVDRLECLAGNRFFGLQIMSAVDAVARTDWPVKHVDTRMQDSTRSLKSFACESLNNIARLINGVSALLLAALPGQILEGIQGWEFSPTFCGPRLPRWMEK